MDAMTKVRNPNGKQYSAYSHRLSSQPVAKTLNVLTHGADNATGALAHLTPSKTGKESLRLRGSGVKDHKAPPKSYFKTLLTDNYIKFNERSVRDFGGMPYTKNGFNIDQLNLIKAFNLVKSLREYQFQDAHSPLKDFNTETQLDNLVKFFLNPVGGFTYLIGGVTGFHQARMLAMLMVNYHSRYKRLLDAQCTKAGERVFHRDNNGMPIWHYTKSGYNDELVNEKYDNYLKRANAPHWPEYTAPSMLILDGNEFMNSGRYSAEEDGDGRIDTSSSTIYPFTETPGKLDTLRSILQRHTNIPKIIVYRGDSPARVNREFRLDADYGIWLRNSGKSDRQAGML